MAVIEELAATAVAGTQLLNQVPGARHEGVVGFWYGKNPGLDRAADATRHANVVGTAALGGAVLLIGDDPASKSSTIPSSCEPMCQSMSVPLLAPGTVAEVIEYGLHAVALSRASGLWTGLTHPPRSTSRASPPRCPSPHGRRARRPRPWSGLPRWTPSTTC